MIVVLVYRPEAADGPHQSSAQDDFDPFNGVEVYGVFMDAEDRALLAHLDELRAANPKWQFLISNEKLKVGFPATLEGKKK